MPYRVGAFSAVRLESLGTVHPATPCLATWSEHTLGEGRARTCGLCGRCVYDVSSLPREEAERLLGAERRRLFLRRDGTVLTSDCPIGARRRWGRRIGATLVFAVLFSFAWVTIAAWTRHPRLRPDRAPEVTYDFSPGLSPYAFSPTLRLHSPERVDDWVRKHVNRKLFPQEECIDRCPQKRQFIDGYGWVWARCNCNAVLRLCSCA